MRLTTFSRSQFFKRELLACFFTFLKPDSIVPVWIRISVNHKSIIAFCVCYFLEDRNASLWSVCGSSPLIVPITLKVACTLEVVILDYNPIEALEIGLTVLISLGMVVLVFRLRADCFSKDICSLTSVAFINAESLSQHESWELCHDCFKHLFNCKLEQSNASCFQLNHLKRNLIHASKLNWQF